MTDDVAAQDKLDELQNDYINQRGDLAECTHMQSGDHDKYVAAANAYIRALEADRDHWQQRALAAEAALKPFALTDDEQLELTFFLDEDRVFLRPDDGNDSVKRGWSKKVTIGDMRRASEIMPDIE